MKNIISKIKNMLTQGIEVAVPFLCLGVVVQLIVGSPLLGWNVVGNISSAIGQFGQTNFIGVAALLILYSYINRNN